MLPETSALPESRVLVVHPPGVSDAAAHVHAHAIVALSAHPQIKAFGAVLGKGAKAHVGILPADHRPKGQRALGTSLIP
jgi:hypothetical protein